MRSFRHIAKLIKARRINHPKGYSQSELSHILGYKNGQFISNVERALCNIPLKMLCKVCEVLDISREELKEAILKDQEETLDNFLRAESNVAEKGQQDKLRQPDLNNQEQSSLGTNPLVSDISKP